MKEVLQQFTINGTVQNIRPFGSGHINDTFLVHTTKQNYVLQRINDYIFKEPAKLMENTKRIVQHLSNPDLQLVNTYDDQLFWKENKNNFWRLWHYIENSIVFNTVENPWQAFEAACAFGNFQKRLLDLPPPRLHEIIPDFHNTPKRFHIFLEALEKDTVGRSYKAQKEIHFALERKKLCNLLLLEYKSGKIPERIVHNDAKLNNVMFDKTTGRYRCVIDLDIVMPGLSLYDFGDLVRVSACNAMEDESDLNKVYVVMPFYKALLKGYLSEVKELLNDTEKKLLAFAGNVITFEQGIRFLTDYLQGDVYYKTHRPEQNLDRCRTQFKLVQSMEEYEKEIYTLCRYL